MYYENYISQVFASDRRLTTVSAYLPLKMLQQLVLSDTIAINDRNYTINEIETGEGRASARNGMHYDVNAM